MNLIQLCLNKKKQHNYMEYEMCKLQCMFFNLETS